MEQLAFSTTLFAALLLTQLARAQCYGGVATTTYYAPTAAYYAPQPRPIMHRTTTYAQFRRTTPRH